MHSTAEVLGDELVWALVLVDDLCLPGEIVGHDVVLEIFPLQLVAGIQNAIARRQVIPTIDKLSPVNKTPDFIDRVWCLVLLLQTVEESGIHVRGGDSGRESLIVDLVSDHRRMIFEVADDLADNPLRVLPEIRIEKIIILARPVVARRFSGRISRGIRIGQRRCGAVMSNNNLGMLLIKPRGNGISRRAEDGFDSCRVQTVKNALHPGKLKIAIVRLPRAPRRFAHANHRDSGFLHQFYISVEPVIRHVFRVVSNAVENRFHFVGSKSRLALRRNVLSASRLIRSGDRSDNEKNKHIARNELVMRSSAHPLLSSENDSAIQHFTRLDARLQHGS